MSQKVAVTVATVVLLAAGGALALRAGAAPGTARPAALIESDRPVDPGTTTSATAGAGTAPSTPATEATTPAGETPAAGAATPRTGAQASTGGRVVVRQGSGRGDSGTGASTPKPGDPSVTPPSTETTPGAGDGDHETVTPPVRDEDDEHQEHSRDVTPTPGLDSRLDSGAPLSSASVQEPISSGNSLPEGRTK